MSNLPLKFAAWVEDVNREDGVTIQLFGKIMNKMFFFIKWGCVPYLFYLLVKLFN